MHSFFGLYAYKFFFSFQVFFRDKQLSAWLIGIYSSENTFRSIENKVIAAK